MGAIRLLDNPVRSYDWGSREFLARLQGRPAPTVEPEAELWMGAHDSAPSHVVDGEERVPLSAWIARDPEAMLGREANERFGGELPFLLKILAVEAPLSVQLHPDAQQAREGFEREERAGLGRDAGERCYRDPRPKPELICALTPFEALVGLRPAAAVADALVALAAPEAQPLVDALRARGDAGGLRDAWSQVMGWRDASGAAPASPVSALVEAGRRRGGSPEAEGLGRREAELLVRLAEAWPGDPAVLAACFLHHVRLAPGECLFVGAGTLHAYLRGAAVEVQANSDNVLRAGLTRKHVAPEEVLRVGRFAPDEPRPSARPPEGVADAFRLERADVDGDRTLPGGSVRILVCVEGRVTAADDEGEPVELSAGAACFVPASSGDVRLAGRGRVYGAAPG